MSSKEFGVWFRSSTFELPQIVSFRGSKSRNKVSVGEPADGSLHFEISRGWVFTPFLWILCIVVIFRYLFWDRRSEMDGGFEEQDVDFWDE